MQVLAAEREAIKTSLNDLQVDTFRVGPDRSPAVTRTAFLETGPSLARGHTPLIFAIRASLWLISWFQ
jgi:hypothetical protein